MSKPRALTLSAQDVESQAIGVSGAICTAPDNLRQIP